MWKPTRVLRDIFGVAAYLLPHFKRPCTFRLPLIPAPQMSSSKSNMRIRALDPDKPMPIIDSAVEPEILDPAYAINRAVLQMPTGMEKEEETVRLLLCQSPR